MNCLPFVKSGNKETYTNRLTEGMRSRKQVFSSEHSFASVSLSGLLLCIYVVKGDAIFMSNPHDP